ncbi:MAG: hypothetical protein AAF517_06445 [Planctomycetota bacterium]
MSSPPPTFRRGSWTSLGRLRDERTPLVSKSLFAALVLLPLLSIAVPGWFFAERREGRYDFAGPRSASGVEVLVSVSDGGFGVGADFYADIRLLDRDGAVLAEWTDDDGRGSYENVVEMVESLRWSGGDLVISLPYEQVRLGWRR